MSKGYKTQAHPDYPKPKSRTAVFIVLAILVVLVDLGVIGWIINKLKI